jgi:hypothetical protein
MAIDRKARKPALHRFVRFSGRALTQGVVNARIDGVPVRIYSTAKTIADCLKYRRKIGIETALHALRVGTQLNKCSRQRLGNGDDSETSTSVVLCNLRIVPEYFCSSGDAHPSVITVDILSVLRPKWDRTRKRDVLREGQAMSNNVPIG